MSVGKTQPYAGFWRRVVAFTLDLIVAFLAVGLGWVSYLGAQVISGLLHGLEVQRDTHQFVEISLDFLAYRFDVDSFLALQMGLTAWALWLLFTAAFESSLWQATPGKKLVGIKVTDYDGTRLEFPQALWRNFSKIFSDLSLCMGYALAGVTRHKQTLHDIIARCLVVKV